MTIGMTFVVGLGFHFLSQMIFGLKNRRSKSSVKILLYAVVVFSIVGMMLTILNLSTNNDLGECGTGVFNPLVQFLILGNIANLLIFGSNFIILKTANTILNAKDEIIAN